jgi:hypothetical protein
VRGGRANGIEAGSHRRSCGYSVGEAGGSLSLEEEGRV